MKTHQRGPIEANNARFSSLSSGALPETPARLTRFALALALAIAGRGTVADAAGAIQDRGLGNVDAVAGEATIAAGLRIRLAQQCALTAKPAFERPQNCKRARVDTR